MKIERAIIEVGRNLNIMYIILWVQKEITKIVLVSMWLDAC